MQVVLYNPRAQRTHRRLPLSVLALARALPERHPWTLVDANVEPDAQARLDALCARPDAALLVTVMPGPQLREAVPVTRRLRRMNPGLKVVWGGYFPTLHGACCVRDGTVDVVVRGPGERTVVELLDRLEAGADPAGLPGTGTWRDGRYRVGPDRPLERASTFGPYPYARLDMERYAARTFLGRRTFNHHTSQGCPYLCNFCAVVNVYGGRWLPDPAEDVIRTVEVLAGRYRADAIEFHDNNFFAWERRTREVAEGITRHRLSWWGEGRIDTLCGYGGATWEAMARSGLRMVFLGAESGDQATLDRMDKGGLRVEQIHEVNALCRRHRIAPEFSFVLGSPGDPEGEARATLATIRRLKADNPDAEIILYLYTPVPLPGMYDEARRGGFEFPSTLDDWLAPPWSTFAQRRDPRTPWMTPGFARALRDFETVLHARFPTASDLNLRPWQRRTLRVLSTARWRAGVYRAPWELRLLQKAWGYRRPEEMGF